MYWNEGHHARPHFHARYAGQAASIDFDGRVIVGILPARALAMVSEWAPLHRAELEANWASARDGGSLEPIDRSRSIPHVHELVDITGVEVVADHKLRLTFADGTIGDVEFTDHEWRGALEPLRDPGYFAQVRVDPESGTIAWPNGVDLAPEPLYEDARRHPVESAHAQR